ncbi:hypothetical protein GCM10022267_75150 [Lentzea roselyniae]|uniref:cAMP-binding domain of CRP or a regulatory subunit of cAMP-dependent protein kinases n=1 Tax=Lentzea roselyniae TaxID=531940 RepID=A0ABP7C5K0_9PSEU
MTGSEAGHHDPRRNRVLAALSDRDRDQLAGNLTAVDMPVGTALYQPGEPISAVYFPLLGVFSILTDLDGPTVEVVTVGDEGMIGLPVFLGAGVPTERAICQVEGLALRMEADVFRHEIAILDGPFQAVLQRYTQSMFTQLARNAACNRSHQTRQRCARWLLMTADRMHSDQFPLTQEFLAQMLAMRRSSVSEVAGALADDGCIRYSRGSITVLDRDRLETNACSCYRVIRDATDAAFPRTTLRWPDGSVVRQRCTARQRTPQRRPAGRRVGSPGPMDQARRPDPWRRENCSRLSADHRAAHVKAPARELASAPAVLTGVVQVGCSTGDAQRRPAVRRRPSASPRPIMPSPSSRCSQLSALFSGTKLA